MTTLLARPLDPSEASRIPDQTPADRDRVADFVRVFSILLVVLGHWLVAVVLVRDGRLEGTAVLDQVPWTNWLTWIFQVLPLFFLVGGFVNLRSWSQARARGDTWDVWLRQRCGRLLTPLIALVAFWLVLVPLLILARMTPELMENATRTAFAPLWFLATYLVVVAFVPLTTRLHQAWGGWSILPFVAAALAVDVLDRAGVPYVAYANLWFVWAGIHQCGYLWDAARTWTKPIVGLGLLALGALGLALLVTIAGYPINMVTLGGDAPNNAGPPTVALFALTLAHAGLLLLLWDPLDGWLRSRRPWAVVAGLGRQTMPLFLWHVTALILAAALVHATGWWQPTSIDRTWWLTRPLWVLLCAAFLLALIMGSRWLAAEPAEVRRPGPWRTGIGLLLVLAGIAGINQLGYDSERPVASLAAIALLAAGLWFTGSFARPRATTAPT